MAMTAPSVSDPLGFDVLVDEHDLDPTGRSATGLELVQAAIVHRLTQEKLAMIGAPDGEIDFGINVRTWVGEATDAASLDAKTPLVDEVLHRDPRIASTTVTISQAPAGITLSDGSAASILLSVFVTTTTGATIDRIVGVSGVSVEFLAAGK